MREIEIKARVTNPEALLAALETKGVMLGEALTQHDIVWGEPGAPIGTVGKNILRIRTENDTKTLLTLKQTVAALDKIEHETPVENAEEMRAIIERLHYELYSDITKTRRKGKLGNVELCFDEVTDLGTFLEAERLCEELVDGVAIQDELWALFEELGLKPEDRVTKGYDVLIYELRQREAHD